MNKLTEARDILHNTKLIPYTTARIQYINDGELVDAKFGGDCRFLAETIRRNLSEIGIPGFLAMNNLTEIERHRCYHVVIAEIDGIMHLFDPRHYHSELIPLNFDGEQSTYNCAPSFKGGHSILSVTSEPTGQINTSYHTFQNKNKIIRKGFNIHDELPSIPDSVVAGRVGRTFMFSVKTEDDAIITLSYNIYDGIFTINVLGGNRKTPGQKARSNVANELATFDALTNQLARSANVPIDEITSHLLGAGERFLRTKNKQK